MRKSRRNLDQRRNSRKLYGTPSTGIRAQRGEALIQVDLQVDYTESLSCSAFFGESMFSLKSGASKVALAFLIKHLSENGFTLLDTQYMTPHLQTFGAVEIPKKKYIQILHEAVTKMVSFW